MHEHAVKVSYLLQDAWEIGTKGYSQNIPSKGTSPVT